MAEDLIDSYRNHYNMCITTLRLFNVFGPDGDSKRLHPPLLNHIVRELKKNKKVVLSGDGSQARDFIHISDIVSAITACLNKKPNTTINICSGQLTSVRAFAASTLCGLADYLGLKYFNIDYKPANNLWDAYPALFSGSFPLKKEIVTFEVNKRSLGSNKKAKEILDWSPNLNIHDLIRESAAECYHKI
jgi:nucleoside-diphosphate-sugar epimerase